MAHREDDDEDCFPACDPVVDYERSADADTDDGRKRHALIAELMTRYRELPAHVVTDFVPPEQGGNFRAGYRDELRAAVEVLPLQLHRWPPEELSEAHLSSAEIALSDGVHAVLVADVLDEGDFTFLTGPLSTLLELDLTGTYPDLRLASAPASEPLVPPVEPVVRPLPEHQRWVRSPSGLAWIRRLVDSVIRVLERVPYDVRSDINVVQLGRDYIRDNDRRLVAEVSWNTQRRLHEMQAIAGNWAERASMEWRADAYAEPCAFQVGDPTSDPEGAACFERFARDTGLWFEDGDAESSTHAIELWDVHSETLVRAAQVLHDEGHLERLIGHGVPVFLNDNLNDPDDVAELNRRANPPEFHRRLDLWSQTWHPYDD